LATFYLFIILYEENTYQVTNKLVVNIPYIAYFFFATISPDNIVLTDFLGGYMKFWILPLFAAVLLAYSQQPDSALLVTDTTELDTTMGKPVSPQTLPPDAKSLSKPETREMEVIEAVVCRSVDNHEPVEISNVFPRDIEVISCYCHIKAVRAPLSITHKWYYQDRLVKVIPLTIKGLSWRTHSSKNVDSSQTGQWKVEIVNDENDSVLSALLFTIE
jgi:hypothetical protein